MNLQNITRPLADVDTLTLVTGVLAADKSAATEAVLRLASGVEGIDRHALVVAMNAVLVADDEPETAPATVTVSAVAETVKATVAPEGADFTGMSTDELVAAIDAGDRAAFKYAKGRIERGVLKSNERKLKAARKRYKARKRGETVETPEPGTRVRTASGLLASRVKALAGEGDRARAGIRATNLLKQDNVSIADIEALSDDECLSLVRRPIRSGDTVLELLESASA
jgi:hypothetical protein